MQWFSGSVNTAIQISRKNNALLIVYIGTDDEKGRVFDELWENIDCQNLGCSVVGIKLKKGEEAARQFSEIYPTPILPAAFLIDQNGKPLEIITHLIPLNNDSFRQKINKAVQEFLKNNGTATPAQIPVSSNSPENNAALEEKVRKAKELLEQKKKLDAGKKIEEDKAKEIERIRASKELQEVKRDREDKALLDAAKQRQKEKLEMEKERERVRAQIKADREDQRQKQTNEPETKTEVEKKPEPAKIASDRCRIQVRLPDGSILAEEFSSSDNLLSLIEIIKQKTSIKGSFSISQLYPRHIFTPEQLVKSFLDNSLTPSASLIVIQQPAITTITANKAGHYVSLISWLLFSPFNFVFKMLTSVFGGGSASNQSQPSTSAAASAGNNQRGMPRSAEVRRRGNVAGLHNPNGDDPEERASFNGNSTQFM